MKIFKYPLEVTGQQTIAIPAEARILTVQIQRGILCLWALVSDDKPLRDRHISIYGTGHEVPVGRREYIGTFQPNEQLVFHVFEEF